MEYAYATCLLSETDAEINEANLKAVLSAAGSSVQESRIKAIVAALEDIPLDELAADGFETAQRIDEDVPESATASATEE